MMGATAIPESAILQYEKTAAAELWRAWYHIFIKLAVNPSLNDQRALLQYYVNLDEFWVSRGARSGPFAALATIIAECKLFQDKLKLSHWPPLPYSVTVPAVKVELAQARQLGDLIPAQAYPGIEKDCDRFIANFEKTLAFYNNTRTPRQEQIARDLSYELLTFSTGWVATGQNVYGKSRPDNNARLSVTSISRGSLPTSSFVLIPGTSALPEIEALKTQLKETIAYLKAKRNEALVSLEKNIATEAVQISIQEIQASGKKLTGAAPIWMHPIVPLAVGGVAAIVILVATRKKK